jgi:transposase
MKITDSEYEKIAPYLPKQRGNVKIENITMINALLYVLENGCKWRALPLEYGKWHSIYVRLSRWVEKGVIERLFRGLQEQGIINVKLEKVSLDSTSVKVHPNACGALKKEDLNPSDALAAVTTQKFIWLPQVTNSR